MVPGASPGPSRSTAGLRAGARSAGCEGRRPGRAGPGAKQGEGGAGFCAFSVSNRCLSAVQVACGAEPSCVCCCGQKEPECGSVGENGTGEADLTVLVDSKMMRMGREKMMLKSSRSA